MKQDSQSPVLDRLVQVHRFVISSTSLARKISCTCFVFYVVVNNGGWYLIRSIEINMHSTGFVEVTHIFHKASVDGQKTGSQPGSD